MGTETEKGVLYLVDPHTGERTCLGAIEEMQTFSEHVEGVHRCNTLRATTVELDATGFADQLAREVNVLCSQSTSLEITWPIQIQRRRHRKKRINKKWAKKYGFDVHECRAIGTLQQTII